MNDKTRFCKSGARVLTFDERLKLIRNVRNLNQSQLCELTAIPLNTLKRYESGERTPKQEQVEKIAKGLRIPSFLLDDSNYGYIELETKGDLIALILEGIKRNLISINDYKGTLKLEFNPLISTTFKKNISPEISDVEIVEAIEHWNNERQGENCDKADKLQIEYALNKASLKTKEG